LPDEENQDMNSGWRLVVSISCWCIAGILVAPQSLAEDRVVEVRVNVPYVVQFGFGSYDVGGLSTNTFRLPLTHIFALGEGRDPVRLKFTGYLGYTSADFETRRFGPEVKASQDYLFLLPQVELQIPLLDGWTLKPYFAAGAGWAFNGSQRIEGRPEEPIQDSYDFLYSGGIGTLYEIPVNRFTASLGARVGWAEEVALGGGLGQGYATFQTGLEIRRPVGIALCGRELALAGSFIYYYFFPAAQFSTLEDRPLEVSNQYEFGTTIGFASITDALFLDNPRIGVSYRFGDGLTGFRVNFGFPF
jgi:hypothetical protein